MARKSNHKTVVFLQDYANKEAGNTFSCDSQLASSLVQRGIAEYDVSPEGNNSQPLVSVPKVESKQKSSSKKNKK